MTEELGRDLVSDQGILDGRAGAPAQRPEDRTRLPERMVSAIARPRRTRPSQRPSRPAPRKKARPLRATSRHSCRNDGPRARDDPVASARGQSSTTTGPGAADIIEVGAFSLTFCVTTTPLMRLLLVGRVREAVDRVDESVICIAPVMSRWPFTTIQPVNDREWRRRRQCARAREAARWQRTTRPGRSTSSWRARWRAVGSPRRA